MLTRDSRPINRDIWRYLIRHDYMPLKGPPSCVPITIATDATLQQLAVVFVGTAIPTYSLKSFSRQFDTFQAFC